jgi:hypothetical protein
MMGLRFCRNKSMVVLPVLIFCVSSLFSQRIIEIKYEQDYKGLYIFSCINAAHCNYVVDLGFISFENVKSDRPLPFHGEVKPGYNRLFALSVINPQAAFTFKYNSGYQKGCIHPAINTDFTYLLPISPGKETLVYEMSPSKIGDSLKKDSVSWYVLRLKMRPGDTIYAARKGIVNEVNDQDGSNDAGQTSAGKENYIEIFQPDCSFAHYRILKKNSAMVKPGQVVSAGEPIGLIGGDAYGRGSEILFSVYYYQDENFSGSLTRIPENNTRIPHYIIPQIWTKKNGKGRLKHGVTYISEFPAAVLNQEMPVVPLKKKKKPS